jgi:hypothetical protein
MVYLVIIQYLYEIYYTVKGFQRFKNDRFVTGVVQLRMVVFPGPFPRHSFIVQYSIRPITAVCTPCIVSTKNGGWIKRSEQSLQCTAEIRRVWPPKGLTTQRGSLR